MTKPQKLISVAAIFVAAVYGLYLFTPVFNPMLERIDLIGEPHCTGDQIKAEVYLRLEASSEDDDVLVETNGDDTLRFQRQAVLILDKTSIDVMYPTFDEFSGAGVLIRMQDEAGKTFAEITGQNIDKRLGIYVDDRFITAPIIMTAIEGGSVQLSEGNDGGPALFPSLCEAS